MFDLKAYLLEFDTLLSETVDVLKDETEKLYDDEIFNIILNSTINLKNIIINASYDKVYSMYPFRGIDNIFNLNIKALDEIERLVYNLKQKEYYSIEINVMLARLLLCEKNNLMAICKLYVPNNKQLECHKDLENNVNKRNLLKALTNNFYYLGVSKNPDVILCSVFESNLKDEYKIPVIKTIIDYHYDGKIVEERLNEIIKLQLNR